MKKHRLLLGLYRIYLKLARTPLSPHFLTFFPLHRRLTAVLRRLCHGVVLDVGSGFSPFYETARKNASYYFSLDYPLTSELSPFEAGPVSRKSHIWGDALSMPVKSDSCDVVICTSVLEHVEDPLAVLREIFRVLRPGGRVIGSVPFGHNLHMEPFDFFRISEYGLRSLAQASGFHVAHIEAIGKGFHALGACAADMLIRNLAGFRSNTIFSMGILQIIGRAALLILLYPLILLINLISPVLDLILPHVSFPIDYVFVYEKAARGEQP